MQLDESSYTEDRNSCIICGAEQTAWFRNMQNKEPLIQLHLVSTGGLLIMQSPKTSYLLFGLERTMRRRRRWRRKRGTDCMTGTTATRLPKLRARWTIALMSSPRCFQCPPHIATHASTELHGELQREMTLEVAKRDDSRSC